jgi:predicted AAA+ superfamily ATPase
VVSKKVDSLERRAEASVREDLATKMVFVAGPRQCGKTTLARRLLQELGGAYFSWDVADHRKALREGKLPEDARLWVFDEIHKLRSWRGWLKGTYDLHGERHPILVTGSARLEAYNRGGESLQGRYYLHRLHPFTLSELCGVPVVMNPDEIAELPRPVGAPEAEALASLLRFGGFPEPLLAGSELKAARWRLLYGERLVREDLRDLESFRDLDRIELLYDRLPDTVGSLLSLNALREDLEVAFETVRGWISALERLYAVFRIAPYGPARIKAVKKSQKLYFWDWGRVVDPGARAENLVVSHLLRLTHWLADVRGEKAEVRFFRDPHGHEVDAIVMRNRKPWMAVEVKLSDEPLDSGLRYLLERVAIPHAFQVSLHGTADRVLPRVGKSTVRIVPAARFLASLP